MKKLNIIITILILIGLIGGGAAMAKPLFEVNKINKAKYIEDEIIVKFKGDAERFRVIKVPEGRVGEKVKEYLERRDVEYAEPNYIAYALMTPNDPYYVYQWHLDNPQYGGINLEAAWDISTGSGVTIAVIDTGIAYENYGWSYRQASDLAETCFAAGYDFVNNDSHPNDDEGHGTHVAGTVAQSTNNNLGVAGVAFDACLMPVKVLNSNGSGSYANVAEGIIWAADNGAQVINLSLGGSANSNTLRDAVAYAYNNGVTVVAAAGNDSSSNLSYPAAYDDYVMAVGATQYDQSLAPYSNYGPSLDLVAPGGNNDLDQNNDGYVDGVLQQTFSKSGWRTSWGYYFMEGTSMASPHLAGVAALVIAYGQATSPDEVRAALEETAEDLGAAGFDETYGWGLVDAAAALGWTSAPECTIDADCDDGLYCNGVEACQAGICQVGTPIDCHDGNPCTTDFCDEATESCQNIAVADGTSCEDEFYCNGTETCQAGICQIGSPVNCDDSIGCTIDSCDEVNDICLNEPDDSYCDNGLYCDGAEYCDGTGCQAGSPIDCSDNNPCTVDSCNEDGDICEYTSITACLDNDGCCPAGCTYQTDNDCSAEPTMYLGDISFESEIRSWGRWGSWCRVTAIVSILDSSDKGVDQAVVDGSWSGAYNRDVSDSTNSNGIVSFKTNWVRGCGTFTFCVDEATKADWAYDSSGNTCNSITP